MLYVWHKLERFCRICISYTSPELNEKCGIEIIEAANKTQGRALKCVRIDLRCIADV